MINHHKEVSIIRSSAAEYLTFLAAVGKSETSVEMRYEDENIRLTQKMMATLYDVSIPAINQHLKRIFSATLAGSFSLGWTHYVALLTISNADERRFYEIEARENSWGARELERQIIQLNSANRSARLVPKAVNDFRGFRLALPVQQGS